MPSSTRSQRRFKHLKYSLHNRIFKGDGYIEGEFALSNIIKTNRNILCCKYTDNRKNIAIGTSIGTVELFKADTGYHYATLYDKKDSGYHPITKIIHKNALRQDKTIICCDTSGGIKCWNQITKKLVYKLQDSRPIFGLTYHPVQPHFLSLGDDGVISLWDEKTGQIIHSFEESNFLENKDGHNNKVFSACFHPFNSYEFVSGGWDRTVQFWDLRIPHSIRYISQIYLCGNGLDISKDGKDLLACCFSRKDSIQIYDYKTNKLNKVISSHGYPSFLYGGMYAGTNFIITGGTNFNIFRLIDLKTGLNVTVGKKLPGAVYDMDVASVLVKSGRNKIFAIEKVTDLPDIIFCAGKSVYQIEAPEYFLFLLLCTNCVQEISVP